MNVAFFSTHHFEKDFSVFSNLIHHKVGFFEIVSNSQTASLTTGCDYTRDLEADWNQIPCSCPVDGHRLANEVHAKTQGVKNNNNTGGIK